MRFESEEEKANKAKKQIEEFREKNHPIFVDGIPFYPYMTFNRFSHTIEGAGRMSNDELMLHACIHPNITEFESVLFLFSAFALDNHPAAIADIMNTGNFDANRSTLGESPIHRILTVRSEPLLTWQSISSENPLPSTHISIHFNSGMEKETLGEFCDRNEANVAKILTEMQNLAIIFNHDLGEIVLESDHESVKNSIRSIRDEEIVESARTVHEKLQRVYTGLAASTRDGTIRIDHLNLQIIRPTIEGFPSVYDRIVVSAFPGVQLTEDNLHYAHDHRTSLRIPRYEIPRNET